MNSSAQSAQGRSRASRLWLAIAAMGLMIGLGAAPALAAAAAPDNAAIDKKKDGVSAKGPASGEWKPVADELKSPRDLKSEGDKSFEFKTAADDKKKP